MEQPPDELDDLPVEPTRIFYRRLLLRGFTREEAGNLTAWRIGLPITEKPWTLKAILDVQAMRVWSDLDRIGGPER